MPPRHPSVVAALVAALVLGAGGATGQPVDQPTIWAGHPDIVAFEHIESAHLAAAERALARLRATKGRRTVASTLAPFDEAVRHLDAAVNLAGLVEKVHPDGDYRD